MTLIADYSDPFEMPPLLALGGKSWAEKQYQIDPEQRWHVPDVYGVWTAKPWIVRDASDRNPFDSEYFFWVSTHSSSFESEAELINGMSSGRCGFFQRRSSQTRFLCPSLSTIQNFCILTFRHDSTCRDNRTFRRRSRFRQGCESWSGP